MDPLAEIEALKSRIARLEKMAGLDVSTPPPAPAAQTSQPYPPPDQPVRAEPAPPPPVPPSTSPAPPPPLPVVPPTSSVATSEAWLARIGIGLLFIGLLFSLKLALDRGWITPSLQLAVGTVICLALLIWGDRVSRHRPSIGNLVFGAGIASLIGVLAAGQHLYHLYGGVVTCTLSLLAALLCFAQALRRDSSVLCILALLGIALAPVFLGLNEITLFAIDGVVAAALALATYFVRGWRSVLWAGMITSWALLLSAVATKWLMSPPGVLPLIQAAIIFTWLGFWLVPVGRFLWKDATDVGGLWLTAFLPGLIAMMASLILWGESSRGAIGGGLLVMGGLSTALGMAMKGRQPLAAAQFCGAAIFGGLAIPVILEGLSCWVVLAGYAFALHLAAKATGERPLRTLAYLATLVCYGALLLICGQLASEQIESWSFTFSALALLASVIGATILTPESSPKALLRILVYLGAIALIISEVEGLNLPGSLAMVLCAFVAVASWMGVFGQKSVGQQIFAHLLFALLIPFALYQLLNESSPTPWWNPSALATCVVGGLAFIPALGGKTRGGRIAYLCTLHIMGLILLWTQFREIGNGAGVSVSWAFLAVVLIIAGVVNDSRPLRLTGMATLVLLLIRLFTFDLAQLDLAAKTLIFLGIGFLLFAAGYFLPKFLPKSSHKVP